MVTDIKSKQNAWIPKLVWFIRLDSVKTLNAILDPNFIQIIRDGLKNRFYENFSAKMGIILSKFLLVQLKMCLVNLVDIDRVEAQRTPKTDIFTTYSNSNFYDIFTF